jgi:hypothetical protein
MYLTLGYAMFYCGGGFLAAAPEIVVVALRSVVLLELVGHDGTLVRFEYSGDLAEDFTSTCSGSGGGGSGNGGASVVDTGGVGSDGREGLCIEQKDRSINITSPAKLASTTTTNATATVSTVRVSIPPSAKQANTIRLVDSSGNSDVTLEVTGLTDDYVRRVADLLDLIIKV